MMSFLWWLSFAFFLYFGSGVVVGLVKKNIKIAKWVIFGFITSAVLCLATF